MLVWRFLRRKNWDKLRIIIIILIKKARVADHFMRTIFSLWHVETRTQGPKIK